MPASFNLPRPVAATLLVALGLSLSAAASAEQRAAAASPAASGPEAAASGGAGQGGTVAWPDSPARIRSARASSSAARGPRDAMEMLRERLAQKLGAVKAPDTDNPNVLRVIAKTGPVPSSALPSSALPSKASSPGASAAGAISADATLPGATPSGFMPPSAMLSGSMPPGRVPSGTRRPSGTLPSSAYPLDMHVAATAVGSASRRAAASDASVPRGLPRPAVTGRDGDSDSAALNARGSSADWAYDGHAGPSAWAGLSRDFSTCATGSRQSPIDIRDGIKVDLDAVRFDYKSGGFRVLDNGHTVQVNVAPGSSIEVLGRHYELVHFDFHRPSEERIDGKQFDMAVHLFHKDQDGRLAVIAVLLQRGSAQPLVQSVWNNLPLEKGEEVVARVALDPNDLLPAGRGYYTYMGSLTTPPCSEGVLWMVMKEPVQLSPEQIGIFARLYPMNARPVQSAAGRLIKESN